jgi:hypothetical protein
MVVFIVVLLTDASSSETVPTIIPHPATDARAVSAAAYSNDATHFKCQGTLSRSLFARRIAE